MLLSCCHRTRFPSGSSPSLLNMQQLKFQRSDWLFGCRLNLILTGLLTHQLKLRPPGSLRCHFNMWDKKSDLSYLLDFHQVVLPKFSTAGVRTMRLLQIRTDNLSVQPQAPKTRHQMEGLRSWKDPRPLSPPGGDQTRILDPLGHRADPLHLRPRVRVRVRVHCSGVCPGSSTRPSRSSSPFPRLVLNWTSDV